MIKNCHIAFSQKFAHVDRSVRIVVVLEKIALSTPVQLWPNPLDAFQLAFQYSILEFCVDGIIRGYKFMMEPAIAVEKGDQHFAMTRVLIQTALHWSQRATLLNFSDLNERDTS